MTGSTDLSRGYVLLPCALPVISICSFPGAVLVVRGTLASSCHALPLASGISCGQHVTCFPSRMEVTQPSYVFMRRL